jgi:shikimate 5-dehydrogenase
MSTMPRGSGIDCGSQLGLLRQAARSLELWTGASAPLDVMREALQAELGAAVNA